MMRSVLAMAHIGVVCGLACGPAFAYPPEGWGPGRVDSLPDSKLVAVTASVSDRDRKPAALMRKRTPSALSSRRGRVSSGWGEGRKLGWGGTDK